MDIIMEAMKSNKPPLSGRYFLYSVIGYVLLFGTLLLVNNVVTDSGSILRARDILAGFGLIGIAYCIHLVAADASRK